MRWNCPHCKTRLEISDATRPSAWSFALCPDCKRFGLIRNSLDSAIKVDLPPRGEKFLRAARASSIASTSNATEPSARNPANTSGGKPIVIKAARRSAIQSLAQHLIQTQAVNSKPQEPASAQTPNPVVATAPEKAIAPLSAGIEAVQPPVLIEPARLNPFHHARLPEPLPEVPEKRKSIFPKAVLLGCLLILVWNGIRFLEIPTQNTTPPTEQADLTDHVTSKAMAPTQIEIGTQVIPRSASSKVFNGPGLQYPVIGVLEAGVKYAVIAVDDQWYQLQAGTQTPAWVSRDVIIPAN